MTNANSPKQPVETIEAVETVEPVEAVPNLADPAAAATAPVPTAASVPPSLWLKTVGRLHAASVHLPIAWTLLWVLAEVVAPAIGAAPLATAALPLGVVTCLSFAPSMATGWLRLGELSLQPGYDVADGIFHRNIMLVAGAVLTVALLLRLLWAFFPARLLRSLYVVVLLAGMALVGFGAHLGGRLVYGDDFLPF